MVARAFVLCGGIFILVALKALINALDQHFSHKRT
jgi:hypothetical protein